MIIQIVEPAVLPDLGTADLVRSEGLHLSDILQDLGRELGYLSDSKGDWDFRATISGGLVWEKALDIAFSQLLTDARSRQRIGELYVDGIYMTPDGIIPDPLTLEEDKFTWRSSNRPIEDQWYWLTQIKSYCRAIRTNLAQLNVYYVMGDYRGSGPQYRQFRFRFENWELAENWQMILNHRDKMLRRNE